MAQGTQCSPGLSYNLLQAGEWPQYNHQSCQILFSYFAPRMAKVKKKREISQENIRDDYSLNMLIKLFGLQGNKCTRCKRSQYEKETAREEDSPKIFSFWNALSWKTLSFVIKHSMQVCKIFSRVLSSSMVHHVFIWWSALSFLGLSERTI